MKTISAASLSSYENRTLRVEFVNGSPQEHHSHQTLKVSYNRLSQTLQRIQRHGGKVIQITSASALDLPQPIANSQTIEKPSTATVKQEDKPQSAVNPEQLSEKNRKSTEKSARPSRRDKKSKHRR